MPPKIIGITGGIGSGKSLISRAIKVLDFFVYDADTEAKKLVYLPEIKSKLIGKFGKDTFLEDGTYNKEKISRLVFSDQSLLKELNNIIHPSVNKHFSNWVNSHQNNDVLFKEAAILFESGSYKKNDANILVTAPEKLRINRVMKRDNLSHDEVLSRIKNQWGDEEKEKLADFIIVNDDHKMILPQLYNILQEWI